LLVSGRYECYVAQSAICYNSGSTDASAPFAALVSTGLWIDDMKTRLALFGLILLSHTFCVAGTLPKEPEFDNGEYMLDLVTNRYNRLWREIYDAGDNRFRLRLGSNSFEQWLLEEELKLSTDLLSRLRFRYRHARLFRNSSEQLADDTFEFEGRFYGNNYLSFFATPTFLKAENSIGLMLQNRRAVNRYSIVFVEFPQAVRNFTEREKGGPDTLLTVFTDKPIRFGVNIRESIGSNVWLRVAGEYIPSFEMADEIKSTGQTIAKERIKAAGIMGWVEYVWHVERDFSEQTALGLDWGYRKEESSRWFAGSSGVPSRVPGMPTPSSADPARDPSSFPGQRAPRLLEMEFDDGLFERGVDDSVQSWEESRVRLQPYAWFYLTRRLTARTTVRAERREIGWTNVGGERRLLETDYLVALVGMRVHLGSRRQSIIEGGLASEFRKRRETIEGSCDTTHHDDHRAYFSFEYAFDESKRVRITEAFELDGEDVGDLRIHDHGFLQMIFGF
jgi:hypothetical protein